MTLLAAMMIGAPEAVIVQAAQTDAVVIGDLTLSRITLLDRVGRSGPVAEVIVLVGNAGMEADELLSVVSPLGADATIAVHSHAGSGRRAVITGRAPFVIPTSASVGPRGQIILSLSFSADADLFEAGTPVTLRFARAGEITVTALPPVRRR